MPKYIVNRPELHYSRVEIEAKTPEEALALVREECEGDEVELEYSHTLENDWSVENESGKRVLSD